MDLSSKSKEIKIYKDSHLLDDVFVKDEEIKFIFKKTEKIVKAIYLISNFFSVSEPLKWNLRQSSLKLLKAVMSFNQSSLAGKEKFASSLNANVLELASFLDITYQSGFITQMNYEILNYEINKLGLGINNYLKERLVSNKTPFNNKAFFVEKSKNDIKDTNINNLSKRHQEYDNVFYKNVANKPLNQNKSENSSSNKRQEDIINLIKNKEEVSVKDISLIISDCSEKTLQRELLKMVKDGVLEKKGERRWSRYSLKK